MSQYVSRTLAHRREVTHNSGFTAFIAVVALGIGWAGGVIAKTADTTVVTEKVAADALSSSDARLIGFMCGDNGATVISSEEDFGLDCVEIRRLSENGDIVRAMRD